MNGEDIRRLLLEKVRQECFAKIGSCSTISFEEYEKIKTDCEIAFLYKASRNNLLDPCSFEQEIRGLISRSKKIISICDCHCCCKCCNYR